LPKTIAKIDKSQANQGLSPLFTEFAIFQHFVQNHKSAFLEYKMLI
jgi:hypothetical protein